MGIKKVVAIDLFCGAGGLTYGLQKSGIEVGLGIDLDPLCEYPYTANTNAEFLREDVSKLRVEELASRYPPTAHRVLVGCAPCQPFSSYTQGLCIRDNRWSLLSSFAALAIALKPEVISMENVSQLTKHEIYDEFVARIKSAGYHISENIVECHKYGIPQTRRRLVLLASRLGEISLIPPTHRPGDPRTTVRHRIQKLPRLAAGDGNLQDPLHCASKLSETNLARIRASRPGGTWKDWDSKLRAPCHRRETGSHYGGVYGRMEWDKPAPTITTQAYGFGSGRFGHPEQDRALSLREAALLQTFPRKYKFLPPHETVRLKDVGRLIGNAVPVRLGEVIGKSIKRHLEER